MRLHARMLAVFLSGLATTSMTRNVSAQTPAAQQPAAGRGQAPGGSGRGQPPEGRGAPPAPVKNPLEGNPDAISAGGEFYGARCASCHGKDAKGTARASDLTQLWASGATDQQLGQSIRRGLPNTLLPHSFGPDRNVWAVLAYLRTMNAELPAGPPGGNPGNAENGQRIFDASCASCHRVNGRGGYLGPDLSRVGATRSRPLVAHKIRHASAYIMVEYPNGVVTSGYQPVTVVTHDGTRVRGVKKNEDAFSIQIVDTNGRFQSYDKTRLRELTNETTSVMPDSPPEKLSDHDLGDLVAYLSTLRAAPQR
jgi:cytochrome c oxidase cbb3-type subunit 3